MSRSETFEGHSLTMANEDYLEAILRVESAAGAEAAEGVRSVDVAELLGVSKASVNKAISTLREGGLVDQTRYGRVALTELGRTYAEDLWRCHRMLRAFLAGDLGVEPARADAEACLMEHALSLDTIRRWMGYLEGQGLDIDAS